MSSRFDPTQFTHEFRRCVSQMQWHCWLGPLPFLDISFAHAQRIVDLTTFGRSGQVNSRLCDNTIGFGHSDQLNGIECGQCNANCMWIGQANVFAGRSHQTTADVSGIFPACHHSRAPIQCRILVGCANRFVQRRNHIVMLVSLTVVQHVRPLWKRERKYHINSGDFEINQRRVSLTLIPSWMEDNFIHFKSCTFSQFSLSIIDSMASCRLFNAMRASPSQISASHFNDDSSTAILKQQNGLVAIEDRYLRRATRLTSVNSRVHSMMHLDCYCWVGPLRILSTTGGESRIYFQRSISPERWLGSGSAAPNSSWTMDFLSSHQSTWLFRFQRAARKCPGKSERLPSTQGQGKQKMGTNLLQFIEAMYFVHEKDCLSIEFLFVFCHGHRLLHIVDTDHCGRQFHKSYVLRGLASIGDDIGQRCLRIENWNFILILGGIKSNIPPFRRQVDPTESYWASHFCPISFAKLYSFPWHGSGRCNHRWFRAASSQPVEWFCRYFSLSWSPLPPVFSYRWFWH